MGHLFAFLLTLQMWGKWFWRKNIFFPEWFKFKFVGRFQETIKPNRAYIRTFFTKFMLYVPILSLVAFHLITCLLFMHSYGWLTLVLNPARFWSLFLALYLWWKAIKLNSLDFKWVLYIQFFSLIRNHIRWNQMRSLYIRVIMYQIVCFFKYSFWLFCFCPVLFIGISRKPGTKICCFPYKIKPSSLPKTSPYKSTFFRPSSLFLYRLHL